MFETLKVVGLTADESIVKSIGTKILGCPRYVAGVLLIKIPAGMVTLVALPIVLPVNEVPPRPANPNVPKGVIGLAFTAGATAKAKIAVAAKRSFFMTFVEPPRLALAGVTAVA